MSNYSEIFVGGQWVAPELDAWTSVINPATEEIITSVPSGSPLDVHRAVSAARKAFTPWSETAPLERASYLARVGDILSTRSDELSTLLSQDVGTPLKSSFDMHVRGPLATVSSLVDMASEYPWEEKSAAGIVVRTPVGVVGAITPWNVPLGMVIDKAIPALLAGCTVVLKPSEIAPLGAWVLANVMREAGLPAGVFNLVSGDGPIVGEALVTHPEVDMISFTGSTRAGMRIASLLGERVARVSLELGGKSANILLDDADFARAIPNAVSNCFLNTGQVCTSLSRLLVPFSHYDDIVAQVEVAAKSVIVGDPHDDVDLGPVVSGAQRDRVQDYIRRGVDEGARLVTGGPDAPEGLPVGFYVKPTVFAAVDNSMAIARDEIFGPVLSIIGYRDEEDAIAIANDSPYGLAGNVFSSDRNRAMRVARRLRTGLVKINGKAPARDAPFGGFKQSGIGRVHGQYAVDSFIELQSIANWSE